MIESINDALIAIVKACGGSKVVGPMLWPDKLPIESAQRALLDCLNEDRPAHLTPEQMVWLFSLARKRGFHAGAEYLMAALGYAAPEPIDPKDELTELLRQSIEQTKQLERTNALIADRLTPQQLRSVA